MIIIAHIPKIQAVAEQTLSRQREKSNPAILIALHKKRNLSVRCAFYHSQSQGDLSLREGFTSGNHHCLWAVFHPCREEMTDSWCWAHCSTCQTQGSDIQLSLPTARAVRTQQWLEVSINNFLSSISCPSFFITRVLIKSFLPLFSCFPLCPYHFFLCRGCRFTDKQAAHVTHVLSVGNPVKSCDSVQLLWT